MRYELTGNESCVRRNEAVKGRSRVFIAGAASAAFARLIRIVLLCAAAVLVCNVGAAASDTGETSPDTDIASLDMEEARRLDEKTGGPEADISEVSLTSDQMIWYVRGISGKPVDVRLYTDMEKAEVSEYGMLGEEGGPAPKTLILLDNSNSVAHAFSDGPERIRSILTRLIWNHQSGERFAIKTFSKTTETVVDYTDNYDQLRLALEQISYQDQYTYLRNVLYEQIYELMEDGEDAYKRIILVSDGSDDSRLGVTYGELTELLGSENYFLPIYTVAPAYLPAEGELDKVFALSRLTDTPYYYLPEYDNPTDVADGIVSDGQKIAFFRIPITAAKRSGEFRGYTLEVKTPQKSYTLEHTLLMPAPSADDITQLQSEKAQMAEEKAEAEKALRQELKAMQERIDALEETEEEKESEEAQARTEAETQKETTASETSVSTPVKETEMDGLPSDVMKEFLSENRKYFFFRSIRSVIWAVVGIMMLMLIGYLIYGDRTRRNRKGFEELADETDSEAVQPDLSRKLTERVVLYDPGQPGSRYGIEIGQDRIIGRSRSRCDIAFPMDRFMAGRQARVFFRDGKVFIENLDPDNTVQLDDRSVKDTAELKNGSRLTLGSTELRVQYE